MLILKNNYIYSFIILSILLAGVYVAPYYFWEKTPLKSGKHVHAQVMYTCSMHPQVMKSEPGPCPYCGMPMTPMKEAFDDQDTHDSIQKSDHASYDKKNNSNVTSSQSKLRIRLSSGVIQKMGVITEIAKKKKISREIRSVAHIDYNESAQVIVNSRVDGWVEKLYARYTGQTIRKGQALVGVYSPELLTTQSEYLQLYNRLKSNSPSVLKGENTKLLQASRKRLMFWNISASQIRRIEKSGKVSRLLTIHSPYSGVVIRKNVKQGEYIKKGRDLFEIADLSTVWAYVHIPEQDISFIKLRMKADMIVPQYAGRTFPGRVSFIFPFMEKDTRDLKTRLSFRNPGFHLKPGMFATVILKKAVASEQIVIPQSAVIRSGTRNLVFVYLGEGIFEPREVRLGVTDGDDHIQILHGVAEKEAVATSGQFLLDSETKLQEAVRKMRAAGMKSKGGHKH